MVDRNDKNTLPGYTSKASEGGLKKKSLRSWLWWRLLVSPWWRLMAPYDSAFHVIGPKTILKSWWRIVRSVCDRRQQPAPPRPSSGEWIFPCLFIRFLTYIPYSYFTLFFPPFLFTLSRPHLKDSSRELSFLYLSSPFLSLFLSLSLSLSLSFSPGTSSLYPFTLPV